MTQNTNDRFRSDPQEQSIVQSWEKIITTLKYLFFVYLIMFGSAILIYENTYYFRKLPLAVAFIIGLISLALFLVTAGLIGASYHGKVSELLRNNFLNPLELQDNEQAKKSYRVITRGYLYACGAITMLLLLSQFIAHSRLLTKMVAYPFITFFMVSLFFLYKIAKLIKKAHKTTMA